MNNIRGNYWPPNQKLLLTTVSQANKDNNLVSDAEYYEMFKEDRLQHRKILRKLIEK